MIWLLFIVGLAVIGISLILLEIRMQGEGICFGCGLALLGIAAVGCIFWLGIYYERWDEQRQVEAFVGSRISIEYRNLIEGSTNRGNLSELVDLEPIGNNVQEWFEKVNRSNYIIKIHTAANENWWLDWGYPDWENPPDLITFGE